MDNPNKQVSEDTMYMCGECRKRSGDGHHIKVEYFSWGGFSPFIEGRRCEHLDSVDILTYVRAQVKWKEEEYQGRKFRTVQFLTTDERTKILKDVDEGVPHEQICSQFWHDTGYMLGQRALSSVISHRKDNSPTDTPHLEGYTLRRPPSLFGRQATCRPLCASARPGVDGRHVQSGPGTSQAATRWER